MADLPTSDPMKQNVSCDSVYKHKQNLSFFSVKLRYAIDEMYQHSWGLEPHFIFPDTQPNGFLYDFGMVIPGGDPFINLPEEDRPYITTRAGAADCGKYITTTYSSSAHDSVACNTFSGFPVIAKNKFNHLQIIAKTARAQGALRYRIVWDFCLEDIDVTHIEVDRYGHVDNSSTKISVNVGGLTTITDNYNWTDNGSSNSNNGNGNGNGHSGGGSGPDLQHDLDLDDMPKPTGPTVPSDPTTPFSEETAKVDDDCRRVFMREASAEVVKPIDNSSCYMDEKLINAIRKGKIAAIETNESAPVPSIMKRAVYSNGSFDSNIKWKTPLVYKLVKSK